MAYTLKIPKTALNFAHRAGLYTLVRSANWSISSLSLSELFLAQRTSLDLSRSASYHFAQRNWDFPESQSANSATGLCNFFTKASYQSQNSTNLTPNSHTITHTTIITHLFNLLTTVTHQTYQFIKFRAIS